MTLKLISGGQTGADRGALEAALELGLPYGGWVPRGRKSEDGQVPDQFTELQEHASADYPPRTWANIRDSDATVLFSRMPLRGGSKLTGRYCREQDKPFRVYAAGAVIGAPGSVLAGLAKWIEGDLPARGVTVQTLNVAGSRETSVPGLQEAVKQLMRSLLLTLKGPAGSDLLGYWLCSDCGTMCSLRNWSCSCGGQRRIG